jgi:hypothetical protein
MADLLRKKVCIAEPYLLLFFYPHFQIVSNLNSPIDYSTGVIYTGTVTDDVVHRLESLTLGKFILVTPFGEVTLAKPSDFIQVFLPVIADKATRYDSYNLDQFLILLKQHYLIQRRINLPQESEQGVYLLFKSLLSSKLDLYKEYLTLLETTPITVLASSVLTFLNNVLEQNLTNKSSAYRSLLNSAKLKFGDRIKCAVMQYIESKQRPDVALLFLLDTLNG